MAGIDEKGPAKPAGIEVGDVIVRFDGRDIKDSRDLPRIVASTPVGKAVDVVVVRKGKEDDASRSPSAAWRTTSASSRPTCSSRRRMLPTATARPSASTLSGITDELRRRFSIKDELKGVVVTRVDPELGRRRQAHPGRAT